jgi:3-phosphoshikimate 1-carboxyvinyltransferase
MKITVSPGKALKGEVGVGERLELPGDKSLSHRAALLAAMAEGSSRIENFLLSGVTRVMLEALTDLGIDWKLENQSLRVEGGGLWHGEKAGCNRSVNLHCGNSATTLRLLAGAMAAWGISGQLDGSEGLRRRPMGRIVEPLQQMGVDLQATNGAAPLIFGQTVRPLVGRPLVGRPLVGRPLRAIDWELPVASAQVKSCILLAALAADGTSTIVEPGPSRDHTERMLRSMGVEVTSEQETGKSEASTEGGGWKTWGGRYITRITPPGPGGLAPINTVIPGDISAAGFLITAALITPGSDLTIRGVGLNPTRCGLIEVLQSMGADLQISNIEERYGEPTGDVQARYSKLVGARVEGETVVRMIDEFPAFAAAAVFAKGTSVVKDARELRVKESDRISDLCRELRKLGAQVEEAEDGFVIEGENGVRGGEVEAHKDHRLAMALAVIGLEARGPVEVEDAEIVAESFPGFFQVLEGLGANVKSAD